jgi:hypothetical protein
MEMLISLGEYMKKKKQDFLSGTSTVNKSPRFGVIFTRVEGDKTKFSRKEKHKKSQSHH